MDRRPAPGPLRSSRMRKNSQADQKGPDARRRPTAAREAYCLYVERAAEGARWAFFISLAEGGVTMTRWIIAIGVGLLMVCDVLLAVPQVFAQAPGGPFDRLSPGNQKIARSLFEAQPSRVPPGTRPLTLDQIAAR